jgi:hypothetical protein
MSQEFIGREEFKGVVRDLKKLIDSKTFISVAGDVSGSGANQRIGYWTAPKLLSGTDDFIWTGTLLKAIADLQTRGPLCDVRTYASFAAAVTAIGATATTLLISTEQAVAADVTVPSTLILYFTRGGSINIATTKIVTINGNVEAGLHQIFKWAGTGKVVFGSGAVHEIYPEWWGAKCDGTTDSSDSIQACIDTIPRGTGPAYLEKGGTRIVFCAPNVYTNFYKITKTINFIEIWNTDIVCPSFPFASRDGNFTLFKWYGGVDDIAFLFDFCFGMNVRNFSLDGRSIAGLVGFSFGATGDAASRFKQSVIENIRAIYCDIGIRVGDVSNGTGPDQAGLTFINPNTAYNISCGFKQRSDSGLITAINLLSFDNGASPYNGHKGCNIYLDGGELTLLGYVSSGLGAAKPQDADIYKKQGGIKIFGAWSDTHGYFIYSEHSSIICTSILSGVRHHEGSMSGANTPYSILWDDVYPLVLSGCILYNSVDGGGHQVIDLGTSFINATGVITNFRPARPMTQEAWIAPTLLNSWANLGGDYPPAGYYKDNFGIVHLRGMVDSGVAADIFLLPVGYRPTYSETFSVISNNAFGRIKVNSTGYVTGIVYDPTYVSLDGITFKPA